MKKRSVTLMEVIIVLVIIGIFATLTLYHFSAYTEKNRAKGAQANLIVIYNAQKRYKLERGGYYRQEGRQEDCARAMSANGANVVALINANLNLDISDPYFTYCIYCQTYDAQGNALEFTAMARRNAEGACAGQSITLTDDNSVVTKNCSSW